jgi:hypothetical protein
MFNPSNLSDAWTENNLTGNNAKFEESVKAYMNSEHRSTTWPLNETQTLFKTLPSVELSNLEATLFITDPSAEILRDIHQSGKEMIKLNQRKRTLTQGILGSLGVTSSPNLNTSPQSNVGNLYRLFQLQPFPWIVKNIPVMPQNQNDQILAIPIKAQSEPIQFSMKQLSTCQQVNLLFICDINQMTTAPTQESCLIALANKQYSDATHSLSLVLTNLSINSNLTNIYYTQPNINIKYISASEIIRADYPSLPEYHS